MSSPNQHEPCFRIYLGKSNWVNLGPQVTAELKAIYEEGKPTRYKLAPGLLIDILPRDVDCNSKTTELPRLMRADLCYDDDDEGIISTQIKSRNESTTTPSTSTLTERQHVVQQNLSRFIKSELEKQGIVDAFPPNDPGQESLPPVSSLAPHRHLGLVPAPYRHTKRTLQRQKQPLEIEKRPSSSSPLPASLSPSLASSSSPLLDPSYTPSSSRPSTKRKQQPKKTHNDEKTFTPSSTTTTTTSSSSSDSIASRNTQAKLGGKKIQPPPPYQLRSSTSSLGAGKKAKTETALASPTAKTISSPLAVDTSTSRAPLATCQPKLVFDYDGEDDDDAAANDNNDSERTDFFPAIDFVTPTNTTIPSFWYNHFPQQQQQQQQQQPQLQRIHPVTLASPSLPIFHHHHHHHHQFQLQPREHQYHHARIQHFPDNGEEDEDNPPAGWDLHEWTNRHNCQHPQQQQQQDFDMYSSSIYSVSSPPPPPPPPPFHRYDDDPATKISINPPDLQQPCAYTHDTSDRGGSLSTLSIPSPSGMYDQMQHAPYPHQHHRHRLHYPSTDRYHPENQYTNPSHLTSFFMPPVAAAASIPAMTHGDTASTDNTTLLSTSSPSPPSPTSHFPTQDH